jgi:hypothetical protein
MLVPMFFALILAFLALFVAISLTTLRYAAADLGTRWIGRDHAIRVYISDVFAFVTLFGAVSSAMLLGNRSESTRGLTVAIAAFLALTTWMFSVWLLSQSQVNRPTKRLTFFLVSGPCTLFVVANWWAILAVVGSMIAEADISRSRN